MPSPGHRYGYAGRTLFPQPRPSKPYYIGTVAGVDWPSGFYKVGMVVQTKSGLYSEWRGVVKTVNIIGGVLEVTTTDPPTNKTPPSSATFNIYGTRPLSGGATVTFSWSLVE